VDTDIGFDVDGAMDRGDDIDVMELVVNDEGSVDKLELVVDTADDIDGVLDVVLVDNVVLDVVLDDVVLVEDESPKQATATSSLCPQLWKPRRL